MALDGSGVGEHYRVNNLPHVVVVDRSGAIRKVLLGVHDETELRAAVDAALR
jgi:hypothetical protein